MTGSLFHSLSWPPCDNFRARGMLLLLDVLEKGVGGILMMDVPPINSSDCERCVSNAPSALRLERDREEISTQ